MNENREKIGRQTTPKKKNNGKKEELQGRTRRGRDQNMNEACHTLGTQWHSGNSGAFFVTLVR
tara:strand:- start:227 stop:415 length:189 start_codon:yes stop_codon:yes gene_type:complete